MSSVFEDQAVLLKIYVDENAWKDGQKAAEWISCRACEMGLALRLLRKHVFQLRETQREIKTIFGKDNTDQTQ